MDRVRTVGRPPYRCGGGALMRACRICGGGPEKTCTVAAVVKRCPSVQKTKRSRFEHLVKAGMTAMEALIATTQTSARLRGTADRKRETCWNSLGDA